jgi:hypothetical protein
MKTPLDAARLYLDRGWQPVPIPSGRKGPTIKGWPNLVIPEAELPRYFGHGENIGIVLRPPLVDIDLDAAEAVALAPIYLPDTGAMFGRASKPGSHRLFIAEGGAFETFTDPLAAKDDKATLLELRSSRAHQTVFPPSVCDGEVRVWQSPSIAPRTLPAARLRHACLWLAVGCLVMRYLGEHAARRPGFDFPKLLAEADPALGEAAARWLGEARELAPEANRADRATVSPHHKGGSRGGHFGRHNCNLHDLAAAIPNIYGWWGWNGVTP